MAATTQRRRVKLADVVPFSLLPLLDDAARVVGRVDPPVVNEIAVECLPNGEIVLGWWRTRQLLAQGIKTVDIIVRADLADVPMDIIGLHALQGVVTETGADDAVRAALFNTWERWRKSLPRRGRRVARRVKSEGRRVAPRVILDEAILEVLGVSRRTLLRHRATLNLAPAEKEFLASLRLANGVVERIGRLPTATRKMLLAELRGSDDVHGVLAVHFPQLNDRRHRNPANARASFIRGLQRGIDDLAGRVPSRPPSKEEGDTLRAAESLIGELLAGGPA